MWFFLKIGCLLPQPSPLPENGLTAQALHQAPWAHVTRQEARAPRARVPAHAAGEGAGLEASESPPAPHQHPASGVFENL